jgi:hypothetical protein
VCREVRPTDPHGRILGFLDRSRYYFFQVAPQLRVYSRGWVDPVPDPLLLRKSGSAGNRTLDLWIWSQELWPLDHRGVEILKVICKWGETEQERDGVLQLWFSISTHIFQTQPFRCDFAYLTRNDFSVLGEGGWGTKSTLLGHDMIQLKPVHILPYYFLKMNFYQRLDLLSAPYAWGFPANVLYVSLNIVTVITSRCYKWEGCLKCTWK